MKSRAHTMRRYLSQVAAPAEVSVLAATALFALVTILSPAHKLIFVISALYLIVLLYMTRSLARTVLYSFFPYQLFQVGREFVYTIIQPRDITGLLYPEGRSLQFVFSPFLIIVVVLIYTTITTAVRTRPLRLPRHVILLIALTLGSVISSWLSPYLMHLSLGYSFVEAAHIAWVVLAYSMLRVLKEAEKRQMLATLLYILIILIGAESIIVLAQVVSQNVLGLSVELVNTIPSFGVGADENPLQFRPIGLTHHANVLAYKFTSLLAAIVLLAHRVKPHSAHGTIAASMLAVGVVVLTQSRSAWLGISLAILIVAARHPDTISTILRSAQTLLKRLLPLAVLIGLYVGYMVIDRVSHTLYARADTGGITTRVDHAQEALQLIQTHSMLGVGHGMYIPASFDLFPDGVVQHFPESIHNGFLLFVAERGIVVTVLYVLWMLLLLRVAARMQDPWMRTGAYAGIIMNYSMMLFHPFTNIASTNILITSVLLTI